MRYFEIWSDVDIKNRWFLGNLITGDEWDFWQYTYAKKINTTSNTIKIDIIENGISLDFTFAGFNIIVLKENIAQILGIEQDVQLIPVNPIGYKGELFFFIAVVLSEFDCLDESQSIFEKFTEEYDRPELNGQYKIIYETRLDISKIPVDKKIFKIKNYNPKVIIREDVKNKFEEIDLKGVKFKQVTD